MEKYDHELTLQEVLGLVNKYYIADGVKPDMSFEHRCDTEWGEQMIYSFVRDFKPTSLLEFGASFGGSITATLTALEKNGKPYKYVAAELEDDIRHDCASNVLKVCGLTPNFKLVGPIEKNLDKVPKKLDYLFLDTNHDLENCLWYIENIFPRMKEGALIHLHDWCISKNEAGELVNARHPNVGPEIWHIFDLYQRKKLPWRKVYWAWGDGIRPARGGFEECASSFWVYDSSMVKENSE